MSDPAATQVTPAPPVVVPTLSDDIPDVVPAAAPEGPESIDITGPAFARRFANLLSDRRATTKRSLGAMARRGDKRFSRRALRQYEAGEAALDMVTVSALASLYEVDIDAIVPLRTEIGIDDGDGVIAAGGVTARFAPGDPDSLLETYLRLVRRLRDQERAEEVSLRREDVERLAAHLGTSGESVVERLGTLMGATKAQRRVMAGLFLTGAMVITVAVPSVAALSGGADSPGVASEDRSAGGAPAALVTEVDPTGSDAGQPLGERATDRPDGVNGFDGLDGSAIDGRGGPVGPGAISIDLLEADSAAEADQPREVDPTAEAEATTPPTDGAADDPAAPADADAAAEPVADPMPVVDPPPPPPAPEPPPPEPAPEPGPAPTTPPEPADVATGPPPVPEPPSVVVDPTPAPAPPSPAPEPPPPPAPPAPEPPPPAEAETVAVGPPPVPAPNPPIVDPPTDG